MIGLVGFNMFNQNNGAGRELWAMTLRQGGGNPGMKVNPIYVKEAEDTESAAEIVEDNSNKVEIAEEVNKIVEANEEIETTVETTEEIENTVEKNEECVTVEESENNPEEEVTEAAE